MIRLILIGLFIPLFLQAQPRYKWKYNTITHQLLKLEEQFVSLPDDTLKEFDKKYELLDNLFDKCVKALSGKVNNYTSSHVNAIIILNTIDSILAENHFFICIKVEHLSTALTSISKGNCDCSVFNNNNYRKMLFQKSKKIHTIDCDLGSFIYLGIGELLGLPLKFIEVPKHNFIRWNFSDGTYINWDVNSGDFYSDNDFRKGLSPTVSTTFTKKQETAYRYLIDIDSVNTIGYYNWVIGRNLKKHGKYNEARKYYELAIKEWNYHPNPKLSLAYLIVFYKIFNSKEDYLLANNLAREVVKIYPDEKENIETLACSYALLGNFKMALITINRARPINGNLKKAFEKGQTGIDTYNPID